MRWCVAGITGLQCIYVKDIRKHDQAEEHTGSRSNPRPIMRYNASAVPSNRCSSGDAGEYAADRTCNAAP